MTDKWYLAKDKDGKNGKIITHAEMLSLSPRQRIGHLYTLSGALSAGLIHADPSENQDINKLTFWSQENLPDNEGRTKPGKKTFLTNQLRDAIQKKKGRPKKSLT